MNTDKHGWLCDLIRHSSFEFRTLTLSVSVCGCLWLILSAAGCSLAPEYQRPDASIPAAWPTTQPEDGEATLPHWQEFIADPKLRQVIAVALENNRDFRIAALNVQRARQEYGIQEAGLLPVANMGGSWIRERIPKDLSLTGQSMVANQYTVNLGAVAWEIDLFGRIRSLADQALQEYLASEQGRRSVQILLISQVAESYLTLAADREALQLARDTLKAQQDSYNLIKRRVELGESPELDLHRAQTQVDTARVAVADYSRRIELDRNALVLLAGAAVPDELLSENLSQINAFPELSAGLPSSVLLGRPDILQAERHLIGANANIGAARAAFFPRISLTAALGAGSGALSSLFKSGSGAWSYGPEIVMPIFDARTWQALPASKTDRDIAVAQYQKAIQTGFREVADALAVQKTVLEEVAAQQSLVKAVAETYRLSLIRYEKGLDTYLDVLDAQRSLFAQQQNLIALNLTQRANQTRLYAVLGGGWHWEPPGAPATATQSTATRSSSR